MRILYASFDEVPSFKAASTHILANCRHASKIHHLTLMTLGEVRLPSSRGFIHRPVALNERNYLKRGERFREVVSAALSSGSFDAFHFRGPWEGLAADSYNVPTLYEANGFPSMELAYLFPKASSQALAVLKEWERRCLERASRILCPSERIRRYILSTYGISEKIEVLPNGYDPVEGAGLRSSTSRSNRLQAVYVGTLHPWQGVHWALKALVGLGEKLSLDIYGIDNKTWRKKLERRIERLGLGKVARVLPPIDRCDYSATLSRYDLGLAPLMKTDRNVSQGCCPVKIIDYLAHGLVVVAPDLFVVRQLVGDSEGAVLYSANRIASLASALDRVWLDRARLDELKQQAVQALQAHPTWDECSAKLTSFYEDIAWMASR